MLLKPFLKLLPLLLLVLLSPQSCHGRKHHLTISRDSRNFFPISTFGFITGGYLAVNVTGFHVVDGNGSSNGGEEDEDGEEDNVEVSMVDPTPLTLGFSIDKTANDALNPYAETSEAR